MAYLTQGHTGLRKRAWAGVRHVAVCVLLAWVGGVHAADPITWAMNDYPPHWILEGPNQDQGTMQLVLALLKEHLGAHEHVHVQAEVPRILQEIKEGNHWCWVGPFRTPEREAYAVFSLPVSLRTPDQILVNKDRLAEFEALGPLSLARLLSHATLRTSFQPGRAYSAATKALLERYPQARYRSAYIGPIRMLLLHRLDYLIEYPLVAFYQARELGLEGQLVALPFREMLGNEYNRVICPRNAWGLRTIAEINAVLRIERPGARYRAIVEKWHDEDTIRDIRKLYDPTFLMAE